jgi:hypothetical protein
MQENLGVLSRDSTHVEETAMKRLEMKEPKAEFFNKGEHYEEDDNRFYRQRQRN